MCVFEFINKLLIKMIYGILTIICKCKYAIKERGFCLLQN